MSGIETQAEVCGGGAAAATAHALLLAFSVHNLGGSSADRRGGGPDGGVAKGWLSSLNTVVGDRQDSVILALSLSLHNQTEQLLPTGLSAATAQTATGPPPLRSIGDRSLSNRPAVIYQSEQRPLEQQSSRAASIGNLGGERGEAIPTKRPLTLSEQGIVHFSVPAEVSKALAEGVEDEGGVNEDTGCKFFMVELWHVVNRSRRTLLGSLALSWTDFSSIPASPRQCAVFDQFQCERYPSAFLAVRMLSSPPPRPLSLSPLGVANHAPGKFNPMMTYFTTIRRIAPAEGGDWSLMQPAFSSGNATSSAGDDGMISLEDCAACANKWELVECQELAVESNFNFKIPLQFLLPVHTALRQAALAWRLRAREERHRQGFFESDEEAFDNGRVLVRVNIARGRGLHEIAAAAAVTATGGPGVGGAGVEGAPLPGEERQVADPLALPNVAGGSGSGGRGYGSANPRMAQPSVATGAGADGSEAFSGGGGGATNASGLDVGKVSMSMRRFGGRMRGMGVKAVALAKIASQASPAAHIRLGAASVQEKMLRQANFFVKVVYEPPSGDAQEAASRSDAPFLNGVGWDDDKSVGIGVGGGSSYSGFCGADSAVRRVVGVTNTEYGSVEPVWGTNANRQACPYNQPRLQHQVSGATKLDAVSDPNGDEAERGMSTEGMETQPSPPSSRLAFNFYVSEKDVNRAAGGSLKLHLYQNMFTLKAGIVDVPVGSVSVPLPSVNGGEDAASSIRKPEWRPVEGYNCSSFTGSQLDDLGLENANGRKELQRSPEVLVGVHVQTRKACSSGLSSPHRRPLPSSSASNLGDGPAAYGGVLGQGQGQEMLRGGSTIDAGGSMDGVDLGSGEWTKVGNDSDSDDEGGDEGAAALAAAAATASSTSFKSNLVSSESSLPAVGERSADILDCYRWMDVIGGPSLVLDADTLAGLFASVDYPLEWIETHCRGIGVQCDTLARVLDVYAQRRAEGVNFRSSLLKKDPVLQYIATNLHIQVWTVRDPATGKDRSYDFVTTGAPAAHALSHTSGGLVTLQARLQGLGTRVLELDAACRECRRRGGLLRVTDLEGNVGKLRSALLEYEALSGAVSMRRAVVVSQAISIAATSFCAKLEMMARGTLDLSTELLANGGCWTVDDLAKRWITTGFLLGFEGLLSIHGKEHIMVEDTVSAMDMLADFKLQILPATPDDSAAQPASDDCDFELEVRLEGKTIQCLIGGTSFERVPEVLWSQEGGGVVRIVPVLFTQGIDIQQSMSHASSSAREKAAFQADINSQNLARLNRYCHRVCLVGGGVHKNAENAARKTLDPLAGPASNGLGFPSGMPAIPARPTQRTAGLSAGNVEDLLGMGNIDIGSERESGREGGDGSGYEKMENLGHSTCEGMPLVGGAVPDWTHPALLDLETAVRDDKINHKNTAILLEAQLAVRRLCGGRVTFCKSGKDRTAMSVTVEEALLLAGIVVPTNNVQSGSSRLAGFDGVGGENISETKVPAASTAGSGGWRAADRNGALGNANVLRAHGVRLMVAEKNIGRPLYSFNALQRQFIPELYQPPPQTIQDVITSALNRDS